MARSRRPLRWPEWWGWELELSAHVERRMEDRGFDELELRRMLSQARRWRPDVVCGRYIIETRFGRRAWEVVVEPDHEGHILVVVTAYRVEP
jgi:hypothetical protein